MAQFTPSQKTIKDFNDGEKYINRIDVLQADTINNLVEGLLYAQENGGGISELDKQHLDKMWNIWSSDGTTDTLVNKVEEVLSAFESFKEGDTIADLLSKKADKSDLDSYVTLKLDAWPIGSIYITWYGDSAHAPGAVLGGSWTKLPQNYCLWTATGTLTDSDSGHELGAMLPNIKGEWQRGTTSENTIYTGANYTAPSGAFVTVGSSRSAKVMASSSSSYTGYQKLGFDASKSNSVYQEGSTVRPPAYRIFAYRRYA